MSHLFAQIGNSQCQPIDCSNLTASDISLDIKRDDQLHPVLSGNKWRKLKHILLYAEERGFSQLASMGGQYSNLLHCLSYAAMLLGWQAHLYVRGHQNQKLTPMLTDALAWGAKLHYVNRIDFRKLRTTAPQLKNDIFWLGEGGYSQLAVKGTIESMMEISSQYDYIVIATATGTSLAGYCQGISKIPRFHRNLPRVLGIAVLNNADEVAKNVNQLTDGKVVPEVINGYEFGGYARTTPELLSFMQQFEQEHSIQLEPVYNGKSFYGVMDLIKRGYFPSGSKILLIHCGGLQGLRT